MLWRLALFVPTFNVIVLETRIIRVLDRFTECVEVAQRGDEGLQRRKIICERLSTGPRSDVRGTQRAYRTSESGCLYGFLMGGERCGPMFRSMDS